MSSHVAADDPSPCGNGAVLSGHRLGVVMLLGAAVAFSLAGFFSRLIALDAPTLMFWRGVFAGIGVVGVIAWTHRGRVWATVFGIGWAGLLVGGLTTVAMTSFIWSLRLSSVAEVSVIYATVPLAAAALGWLLLRERAGWRMLAASLTTVAGVSVMMGGGSASGHLRGDLLAGVMTLASALFLVVLRWRRDTPMLPAMALASFLTALLAMPWATPFSASAAEIGWSAVFGVTQLGLGLMLMTLGARYVTATESALYGALDAPLAPAWVWIAFGEAPTASTLVGGAMVLTAVLGFIASDRPQIVARP